MGFNISVYSEQVSFGACRHFIDRSFYDFINSGEQWGEESILLRSGRYYGLDLSPLLRLVYTWGEVTPEEIRACAQPAADLLALVAAFRDAVAKDPSACDHISYLWYDRSVFVSETQRARLLREAGDRALPCLRSLDEQRRAIEADPNPYRPYFEGGQLLMNLDALLAALRCLQEKGATEVYLAAG